MTAEPKHALFQLKKTTKSKKKSPKQKVKKVPKQFKQFNKHNEPANQIALSIPIYIETIYWGTIDQFCNCVSNPSGSGESKSGESKSG